MIENPVVKWIPLFPSDEIDDDKERKVAEFIEKLVTEGVCEIKIPGENKKVLITYREGDNPNFSTSTIDRKTFRQLSNFMYGFTKMFVVDILQETDIQNNFEPVGHRDYRIAKFSDECVANGNFAAQRRMLPEFKKSEYQSALKDADANLGPSSNGVELSEKLRGKKLGKFLMAISFELLSRLGVDKIDLSGSVSDSLVPIVKKFGYDSDNKKLDMKKVKETNYLDLILPFIN